MHVYQPAPGSLVSLPDSLSNCPPRPAGSLKSKIHDRRYKCSGNMQVEVEGQWLPVCKDAIATTDIETLNTMCSKMECGSALKLLEHFGPPPSSALVISKLQWNSRDDAVTPIVTKSNRGCALAGIQCSGESPLKVGQFNV